MANDTEYGRSPDGSGHSAEPEPSCTVSAVPVSVPNADDDTSYRMNPHFRRFLDVVGRDIQRAAVAWAIAKEAFAPTTPEAEFEVWQDDAMVAGCSGPRGQAIGEAVHYAVVYQTDDHPCVIQEIVRREIPPDDAHDMLASAIEARRAATLACGICGDVSMTEANTSRSTDRA